MQRHTMPQTDEDLIRALETQFNAAWDRHDPEGMAESLADDAQFITVNGAWTTTRNGFRDLMARLHGPSGAFRASTRRTPEMSVTFLAPDIAILHSRFWIDGEDCSTTSTACRRAKASARAWCAGSTDAGGSLRHRIPTCGMDGGIRRAMRLSCSAKAEHPVFATLE